MKSFSELIEQTKNDTVEFMRHSMYDQEYKTVRCDRCGMKVGYESMHLTGICHKCAVEEDLMDMRADSLKRMEEREFMTMRQGDNQTSSL